MRTVFVILVFMFSATIAVAQNVGIQFGQMPVGTKMYFKDYEGDTWVQEYRGKSGKYYVLKETHSDRNLNVTRKYNAAGHLVSVNFNSGYQIKYSPHRCDRVIGQCSYRYRGNPKRNGTYNTVLTQRGSKFSYAWAKATSDETFDSVVTLGQFNVLKEETWTSGSWKTRFVRLVKIEAP